MVFRTIVCLHFAFLGDLIPQKIQQKFRSPLAVLQVSPASMVAEFMLNNVYFKPQFAFWGVLIPQKICKEFYCTQHVSISLCTPY